MKKSTFFALMGAGAYYAIKKMTDYEKEKNYNMNGRTVLITGGSRGLGLEMAREVAHQGADIVICARDAEELQRAEAELKGIGVDVLSVVCDLTDQESVKQMVAQSIERFGHIDMLINNAGIIQVGPYENMQAEDFRKAIETNYMANVYTVEAVLPHMQKRNDGRIINISSVGGRVSVPHLLPYSASKFAFTGFSEGLRGALKSHNIKVTTVSPGLMRTGSPYHADIKGQHQQEFAWFAISDSLPLLSIDSTTAARKIIKAAKRGASSLTLTWSAKLISLMHGIAPGATADYMGLYQSVLPKPAGKSGNEVKKGYESQSNTTASSWTQNTQEAAIRNNEMERKEIIK